MRTAGLRLRTIGLRLRSNGRGTPTAVGWRRAWILTLKGHGRDQTLKGHDIGVADVFIGGKGAACDTT